MATSEIEQIQQHVHEINTGWMGTAGSQIFFMQLGFLCYEVGFVKKVWAPSIILKNIEDTFVGILTYLTFTHTLATSPTSLFGLISIPNQIFLINVEPKFHGQIFLSAVFATTCATIISGAVLERMKNKAYLLWCFLVILVNYSVIAHWVWHPDGWLSKLGFIDCAGAIVVHSTGGVAGAIAVWKLGPRRDVLNKNGTLKPVERASRPIIHAIGAFILWFGWFAFNISSAFAANPTVKKFNLIGTSALITMIGPTFACCSALILMYWGVAKLSYENLLSSMLAGLVSITGACFTITTWEAATIGLFASPIYFLAAYITRTKLKLDDPIQIIAVHLCCGIYSCICEGIFAYPVMGSPGLVFSGYKHFSIQILGVFACLIFNIIACLLLWYIVMEKCFFRKTPIAVSVLDTYLGVSLFNLHNSMALEEIIECKTNLARQIALKFHEYTVNRFCNEQFDFLIVINIFREFVRETHLPEEIMGAMASIIETYMMTESEMSVNVSGAQRKQWMKIYKKIKKKRRSIIENDTDNVAVILPSLNLESTSSVLLSTDLLDEQIFDGCYDEIFKIVLPVFTQFLHSFNKKKDTVKGFARLPFELKESTWLLIWDGEQTKTDSDIIDITIPKDNIKQAEEIMSKSQKTPTDIHSICDVTPSLNEQPEPSATPQTQLAYIIHSTK